MGPDKMNQAAYPPPAQASCPPSLRMALLFLVLCHIQSITSLERV